MRPMNSLNCVPRKVAPKLDQIKHSKGTGKKYQVLSTQCMNSKTVLVCMFAPSQDMIYRLHLRVTNSINWTQVTTCVIQ